MTNGYKVLLLSTSVYREYLKASVNVDNVLDLLHTNMGPINVIR